jgi:hypothetical protein
MVTVAGNVVKIADGRHEVTARFCTALPVLQIDPAASFGVDDIRVRVDDQHDVPDTGKILCR